MQLWEMPRHENAKNLHDTLCDENLEEGHQTQCLTREFTAFCQMRWWEFAASPLQVRIQRLKQCGMSEFVACSLSMHDM